jgi:predicted aminopeptidase
MACRFLLLALLSGCTGSIYLAQAVAGQAEMLDKRRSLDSVVNDKKAPAHVKALLAEVPRMKAFAVTNGLTPTKSYERYVDLKRPAAVWVVSASAPLAFVARTWWFPIVGDVPYLGWFKREDARRFALSLQQEGLDVSLRPAAAYSTLGFFNDPILSTMITDEPDAAGDFANTVFHESLHATLYVPGRTDVSEGIASFVGDRMAKEYLTRFHAPEVLAAYASGNVRGQERLERLRRLRADLVALYQGNSADKAAQKGRLIMEAKHALGIKRAINNATLAELGRYQSGEAELALLFERCGHDWRCFLAALRAWIARDKSLDFKNLE